MADITPPDYTSSVGRVRNLINDTVQRIDPANPTDPKSYLFDDGRLQAFIDGNLGTGTTPRLKFAAADAIDAIADNEVLVSKKIRTEDLQTDGPAVANALRMHSQTLRTQQKLELDEAWELESIVIVDYQREPSIMDLLEFNNMYWQTNQ
jgi:hypothetical protein